MLWRIYEKPFYGKTFFYPKEKSSVLTVIKIHLLNKLQRFSVFCRFYVYFRDDWYFYWYCSGVHFYIICRSIYQYHSIEAHFFIYLFSILWWNECYCAAKAGWHAWHQRAKRVVTVNHCWQWSLLTCFTVNQHVCGFKGTLGEQRAQSATRPAKTAEYISHYAQIQDSQQAQRPNNRHDHLYW